MTKVDISQIDLSKWESVLPDRTKLPGRKYGHLTVRRAEDGGRYLECLVLNVNNGSAEIVSAPLVEGCPEFPSITGAIPAAHWAEQAVGDMWGLHAAGHPRWKSLLLHEAWSPDEIPFGQPIDGPPSPRESKFMSVSGQGVHEIPVGPIHAGIIEPGHFRFSCIGEVIANLEIRMGYVHRGIEARLAEVPWRHVRHVVEAASTDSAIANSLAHAEALESLWDFDVPMRAAALRTIALEIERLANHLGDLGSLASDVGFALGAATFGRLRGKALGFGQTLAGTRFQRGFICPGGVTRDLGEPQVGQLSRSIFDLRCSARDACRLFFENPGAQERIEGVGILRRALTQEFGMVGPAARASGSQYDSRCHFAQGLFPVEEFEIAEEAAGDVLARALVRRKEVFSSLRLIEEVLTNLPVGQFSVNTPDELPANKVAVGVVEAWRGELIHWITTDQDGKIARYAIRDPSFQNWTGVAIAVRGNLLMDFPLINKSFNLSYSGNDL